MSDEQITESPPDEVEETAPPEGENASDDDGAAPTALGATKYVHAAFFVVGIVVAFVAGKVLAGVWNALAAWAPAVRAVPQLLLYGEDERPSFTMGAGIVIGLVTVVRMFRNAGIRQWADDVALELSKVVWPTKEIVTNGTIVVIVASALATVYVGLLDRLWGFVTTLVYGA